MIMSWLIDLGKRPTLEFGLIWFQGKYQVNILYIILLHNKIYVAVKSNRTYMSLPL